jgi:hypothetical protein
MLSTIKQFIPFYEYIYKRMRIDRANHQTLGEGEGQVKTIKKRTNAKAVLHHLFFTTTNNSASGEKGEKI